MDIYTFRARAIRISIFVFVLTFGFPFILAPIVKMTNCADTSGACGAAAIVFGTFLKLAGIIAISIYAVRSVRSRVQHARLPFWIAPLALLLILGSGSFLFGFGNFWGANFSAGLFFLEFPWSLICLGGMILFLADFERSRPPELQTSRTAKAWKMLLRLSATFALIYLPGLALLLSNIPGLAFLREIWLFVVLALPKSMITALRMATNVAEPVLTLLFLGSLLAIWRWDRPDDGGEADEGAGPDIPPGAPVVARPRPTGSGNGAGSFGRRGMPPC